MASKRPAGHGRGIAKGGPSALARWRFRRAGRKRGRSANSTKITRTFFRDARERACEEIEMQAASTVVRPSRRPPCGLLRMRKSLMALRKYLILRKLRSSCLEGRTAPIPQIFNSFTSSYARTTREILAHHKRGLDSFTRSFAGTTRENLLIAFDCRFCSRALSRE